MSELIEYIERDPSNKVSFVIDAKKTASDSKRISTFLSSKLRSRSSKDKTLGKTVFYAFPYKTSDEVNDILRSVKGTGSMFLDHAKLELFMMKTARHMSSQLPSVDVIVCPKSSSAIAKKFAHLIGRYSNAEVIYEAFEKTKFDLPQDREDALNYVVNKFIDVRRFEEEYKADAATKRKELRALASSILNSINKTGKIEMKKIRKSVARFVHNFMSTSSHINTKLSNKRVLIVDDSFSSGGTMTDMIRHVINNNAKEVFGAVLFLQTT